MENPNDNNLLLENKKGETISISFKICILLFANIISGILLLYEKN